MTYPNFSQRERSQSNPLNLGRFSQTSLRLLTGSLGPKSQIIEGGYGNYTYNHWFKVTLDLPAWIILIKAGSNLSTGQGTPRSLFNDISTRFSFGVYDLNKNPIQGRIIHQEPQAYWGHVAGARSDLYNTSDVNRVDKDDEMFFELEPGSYLICISSERNEEFNYAAGLVIEFPSDDNQFILLEDNSISYMLQENILQSSGGGVFIEIPSNINSSYTLDEYSAYSVTYASIGSSYFIQVNNKNPVTSGNISWIIGPDLGQSDVNPLDSRILLDATENWSLTFHEHSLSEWKAAWEREHSQDDKFPSAVFAPYANAQ